MDINYKVKLNNGVEMPIFGLGVYQSQPGETTEQAVLYALDAGYIHIDTAALYSNEKDVGNAIRNSKLKREEVFVTTKLWNSDHGYDNALRAFETSLKNLEMDYIDLYLIHWPVQNLRKDSWKALEKMYDEKLVKAIGVSNYTIPHLQELLGMCNIAPTVNQVEFSPYLYQKELHEFCKSNNIQLEAYSPITQGQKLKEKVLVDIANKYSKSTAQLLIRWAIEHDIVVIPKSVNQNRIIENANIFDFKILDDDMKVLDSLNEDFRVCWDPTGRP